MTEYKDRRAVLKLLTGGAAVFAMAGCGAVGTTHNVQPVLSGAVDVGAPANVDPYEALYASRGAAYSTVVAYSHYNAPIIQNGQPRGNSRIWGDAPRETQRYAINALRAEAAKAGMTRGQEAMCLAIAYVESGFNPDAAAGTTSAQGLGQFIRKTGAAYGLTDENLWEVRVQAQALVAHTRDNYLAALAAGFGREYVYARHHDGDFTNKFGGLDIAQQKVIPMVSKVLTAIYGN